jgi:hypothetical protein
MRLSRWFPKLLMFATFLAIMLVTLAVLVSIRGIIGG